MRLTKTHLATGVVGLASLVGVAGALWQPRSPAPPSATLTQPSVVPATQQPLAFASLDADEQPVPRLAEPTAALPVTTAAPTPGPTPAPRVRVHVVEPGETIARIAQRYGIGIRTLVAANGLTDPDQLKVGQELQVPATDGVLHTLQPGETLVRVAERYGVAAADLVAANGLAANPDLVAAGSVLVVPGVEPELPADLLAAEQQAAAASEPTPVALTVTTYVIQPGDTLRSIAQAHDLDILSLIGANGLDDPNLIRPGREIRILPARSAEHIVQPGETLANIAARYEVEASALLRANGITNPDLIHVGTPLIVPGATVRPAPPPVPTPTTAPRPAAPAPAPAAKPAAPAPAPRPAAPPPAPASKPAAPVAQAPASAPGEADAEGRRVITAKITGYALGAGASSSVTASGARTRWGTVAADTRLYPFGTRIMIEGFDDMVFTVQDTGSAVRGNIFDIWFPDIPSAVRMGTQTRRVTILPPGS